MYDDQPLDTKPPLSPEPSPDPDADAEVIRVPWAIPSGQSKLEETATEDSLLKRPPRMALEVEVDLESESCFYSGLTENISEGGLFVATFDLHPVGTRFTVSLTLHDMPPMKLKAEVRWIRDSRTASVDHAMGMGMSFLALSEEDRAMMQAFLEFRTPLLMDGV